MDVGPLVLRQVWAHVAPEGLLMHDNQPPPGNLALPEYDSLQGIFATLRDKVTARGEPCMGTFLIDAELMGVLVVGRAKEVHAISRILMAVGQSPLVRMPEKQ